MLLASVMQKILLASPRGFCAGVHYAVDIVDEVYRLFHDKYKIYILKEIVHNKTIVQEYIQKGIQSVQSIEEVPTGAILIFSAHGVPPEFFEQAQDRGLYTIDATCPLVRKVHREAIRFAAEGYYILYIGHKGHDEAIGVLAECPEYITLIDNINDARVVEPPQTDKLVYLTQTTLSLDETRDIIQTLEERFPNIQAPKKEDICYATTNRQLTVKALAKQCDAVIVVGSQNSSNSQRLREAAEKQGIPAYLIDDKNSLDISWLERVDILGITAGASAPDKLVQEIINCIEEENPTIDIEEFNEIDEKVEFPIPDIERVLLKQTTE